jgi:DNA mismatch repair ATPase MutS
MLSNERLNFLISLKQIRTDFFAIALFESTTGKTSVNQIELSELSTVIVRDQPREILVEEVHVDLWFNFH